MLASWSKFNLTDGVAWCLGKPLNKPPFISGGSSRKDKTLHGNGLLSGKSGDYQRNQNQQADDQYQGTRVYGNYVFFG